MRPRKRPSRSRDRHRPPSRAAALAARRHGWIGRLLRRRQPRPWTTRRRAHRGSPRGLRRPRHSGRPEPPRARARGARVIPVRRRPRSSNRCRTAPRRRSAPPSDPPVEPRRRARAGEPREREPRDREPRDREPRDRRPLPPLDRRNPSDRAERSDRYDAPPAAGTPRRAIRATRTAAATAALRGLRTVRTSPDEPAPTARAERITRSHGCGTGVRTTANRGWSSGHGRAGPGTRPPTPGSTTPSAWRPDAARQGEHQRLVGGRDRLHGAVAVLGQPLQHATDQNLGHGRPRGHADGRHAVEPRRVDVLGVVDQVGRRRSRRQAPPRPAAPSSTSCASPTTITSSHSGAIALTAT